VKRWKIKLREITYLLAGYPVTETQKRVRICRDLFVFRVGAKTR